MLQGASAGGGGGTGGQGQPRAQRDLCLQTQSRRDAQNNRWTSRRRPRSPPPPQLLFPRTVCGAAHLTASRSSLRSVFLFPCLVPHLVSHPVSQTETHTDTQTRAPPRHPSLLLPSVGQGLAETLSVELSLVPHGGPHQPPQHPGLGSQRKEELSRDGEPAWGQEWFPSRWGGGAGDLPGRGTRGAKAWSGAGGALGGQAWPLP